jgi:membrane fusion protein, multidrug efflux system
MLSVFMRIDQPAQGVLSCRPFPPALIAFGTAMLLGGCHRAQTGGQAGKGAPPVAVVAGKVTRRDTPIYLDGIGTVSAFNTVTIRTQVDGQIEKIVFKEGQDVKSGDLLVVIDPRPFQAALDQAGAKKAEDIAQLSNATITYDRNFSLLGKGLVQQQTVDTLKATVDQMKAMVQADDAAAEQASLQLAYTSIRAPFDGRVGIRQVDTGNVVHTTDANGLVVLTELKPLSVVFSLPQENWPQIQQLIAGGATLPVLAYGSDNTAILDKGVLAVVDNEIDTTTGTIRLKATFPNANLALWPGQFVNVRLLVETRKGGLVVPSSVVQRGPQGAFAFVIKADSTVEMRPIQVGQIDAGRALIDKGLQEGESVVVDGQYKLQVGSTVAISPETPATAGKKP